MRTIEVTSQLELDAALAKAEPNTIIICRGSGYFSIYGSAQVTASDSAQVRAYDSAQVTAYGSAQVTASGSAQVTASDSAQVTASGSAQVRASKFVAVTSHGRRAHVDGGVLIQVPTLATAAEWCEFYGAEPVDGVVTLYKAVDASFKSGRGFDYTPGTQPEAPDWDGGKAECGGGLHFCARPVQCLEFFGEATRYVACPVLLTEIVVHPDAKFPSKVKARGVCAPVYEVDIDGKRVDSLAEAST